MSNPSPGSEQEAHHDADVTVILFHNRKVTGNHACYKGELDEAAAGGIVEAVRKIGK